MINNQPQVLTVDLVSLQSGGSHRLSSSASQQFSLAGPPPSVRSGLDPGQPVSGLPGKAIGRRWCAVDRPGNADLSDSENCDGGLNRPDECFDASGLSAPCLQTPESQDSDDGGPWQVVTRRRSRSKRRLSPVIAPAGQGSAWIKKGTRGKSTSASPLPEKSSADSGGQHQRLQVCNNDPVSLPITSCSYWPLCIKSFARLSKMDWRSFQMVLMKVHRYQQIKIASHDFLYFQHVMTAGLQVIRGAEDVVFLVGPFKVMLSGDMPSADALLLSLVVERVVPGFLSMLGESFVGALLGVDHKHEELITAITELLAQICQEDECWLDRLGWNKHSTRQQCNLFSSIAFLFKHANKSGLTLRLHQQVGISWLEKQHYATVQRLLTSNTIRSSAPVDLRDLRASLRAICYWLEARFFVIAEARECHQLIDCFARVSESISNVMERLDLRPDIMEHLDLQPDSSLLSIWQVVAQWSFFFRKHLSDHLGYDRAISLLWGSLQYIHRWPDLEKLAFELRLTLLGIALMKCEALLRKRNRVPCSQVWLRYENMLETLLAKCSEFMRDYRPPFKVASQWNFAHQKKHAQLNLELKESKFYRLDCTIRKTPRERIQDNLRKCRRAFDNRWRLSENHLEIGTIELAKWCFLAGEYDAGVRTLTGAHFDNVKLGWRKAELLADHHMYQAAVDEFLRIKALSTGLDEDRNRRDQIDDQIAMTQLQWYRADDNTDHLISAYQLSVALLGRCSPRARARYEGGLAHIVNAMKNSGLRFEDYVEPTLVLGYLLNKDGCGIKSWRHFSILLHTRHKLGLTDADIVHKVASEVGGRRQPYLELGKKS